MIHSFHACCLFKFLSNMNDLQKVHGNIYCLKKKLCIEFKTTSTKIIIIFHYIFLKLLNYALKLMNNSNYVTGDSFVL